MKFEHLIQINDPQNPPIAPPIAPLTRSQIWRGLVHRARQPKQFIEALDACEVNVYGDTVLTRTLTFGQLVIHDQVTFTPEDSIRYDIEASSEVPGGTLLMTIEEPGPGQLFVRFAYDTGALAGGPPREAFYDEYVKQAYVEADVESIMTIRKMLAEGAL